MAVDWVLIRATGMTAVVLLSASMILGLMMSLRITTPRWPGRVNYDTHRFVTGVALWVVGVHIVLLVLDSWADIDLADLVIPFASGTRTFATGLGTLAFVTLTIVWFTSIYRKRLGQTTWRSLHYLTFGCYLMAIGHGVLGGTDTGRIWAWPIYAASVGVVGCLTWQRIRTGRRVPRAVGPVPSSSAVRAATDGSGRVPVVGTDITTASGAAARATAALPPLPSHRARPRGAAV